MKPDWLKVPVSFLESPPERRLTLAEQDKLFEKFLVKQQVRFMEALASALEIISKGG